MAVTLEQARLNTQDDIQAGVIDIFRKNSLLLDHIVFHDAVSPAGAGSTLTYGYTRLVTEGTAAFRAINSEYSDQEATKERKTVELKVFGGSFAVDRVISKMGGLVDEIAFQVEQKAKSTRALFSDTFINGDSGQVTNAFDGIDKAITGSSTEMKPGAPIDLSTSELMDTNGAAFLDLLDEFASMTADKPSAWFCNSKLLTKIKSVARRAGYLTHSEDAFGRTIDGYDGIPLIDLGDKPATTDSIIGIDGGKGTTSLYSVCLGMDHIHGVSISGQAPLNIILPNFKDAGAVKRGEVEMIAAIAMKQTRSAAVLRDIKVKPVL